MTWPGGCARTGCTSTRRTSRYDVEGDGDWRAGTRGAALGVRRMMLRTFEVVRRKQEDRHRRSDCHRRRPSRLWGTRSKWWAVLYLITSQRASAIQWKSLFLVIEAAPHCVPFPSRFFALFAFTSSAPGPVDFYLIFCEKWPFLSLSNAWAFHSPFLSFFL